ncbi:MAG TPA: C39 family peptidase [Thermoanaerobaculia bacterium]|jgi:hypothetical protein|nr:C39 family peptidase [Thermoanaerobaculia bacterium]
MPVPEAFADAETVDFAAPEGTEAPTWVDVQECVMSQQENDEWCWAACTQAIERALGNSVTQCSIANAATNLQCCDDVDGEGANALTQCVATRSLQEVLDARKRLLSTGGPLEIAAIRAQIKSRKRPLGCFIRLPPDNHFVVIAAYSATDDLVGIFDPAKDVSQDLIPIDLSGLAGYRGGNWEETYFIR